MIVNPHNKISSEKITGILLLACCLIYHLPNLFALRFFNPFSSWTNGEFVAHVGKNRLFSFSVPSRAKVGEFSIIDEGSRQIGQWGEWLQQALGRIPPLIVKGNVASDDGLLRLYLREEVPVSYAVKTGRLSKTFIDSAKNLVEALRRKGVSVILVPVPTKVSIERKHLPPSLPAESPWFDHRESGSLTPESNELSYQEFSQIVPTNSVDLFQVFSAYQQEHPKELLYHPTDTHWSSLAIALTAQAIQRRLKWLGVPIEVSDLVKAGTSVPSYDGDLLRQLLLPEIVMSKHPGLQWFEPIYELSRSEKPMGGNLVLAGSCYSMRHKENPFSNVSFSLGGVLARGLGTISVESNVANQSPTAPFQRIIDEKWVLSRGDVLVWEFPVRRPPFPWETVPTPFVRD